MDRKMPWEKSQFGKEVQAAVGAVREASRLCRAVQNQIALDSIEKSDKSPVTIADYGSQALICRALYEVFPGVSIVSEEESSELQKPENADLLDRLVTQVNKIRQYSDAGEVLSWIDWGKKAPDPGYFWTVDPIDGTKGFLRKDQYAIALALISKGEVNVGVLACPNLQTDPNNPTARGAIFAAVRGAGAFELSLESEDEMHPIQISDTSDPVQIRFLESFESAHSSHDDSAAIVKRLGVQASPIRMDSQAKYTLVAKGMGDAYLRLPKNKDYREKIWDHAAGALLVAEAGGMVTDIRGKDLDFTLGEKLEQNAGVIATNGKLHEQILKVIRDLGIS
jgi:3'(2'), 5'-bisphosphate nucleotidase